MKSLAILFFASTFSAQHVLADCSAVPEKKLAIVVESCEAVISGQHPAITDFIDKISDEFNKTGIETSYTGMVLTTSDASYFVHKSVAQACSAFDFDQAIDVVVQTACCDGDPNAPCLLGISEYIAEYGGEQ